MMLYYSTNRGDSARASTWIVHGTTYETLAPVLAVILDVLADLIFESELI